MGCNVRARSGPALWPWRPSFRVSRQSASTVEPVRAALLAPREDRVEHRLGNCLGASRPQHDRGLATGGTSKARRSSLLRPAAAPHSP